MSIKERAIETLDIEGKAVLALKDRIGDEFVEGPPPLVMEVSFAITAWAQAVEDEHEDHSGLAG